MEKRSLLSRLKNKYLLLGLSVLTPLLLVAGTTQPNRTDVKCISISATVAPTQTPVPTLAPTDTATPTLTPTNTPVPTRVYIAPTRAYIPPTQAPAAQSNNQLDNNNYYKIQQATRFTVQRIRCMEVCQPERQPDAVTGHIHSASPAAAPAHIMEGSPNG